MRYFISVFFALAACSCLGCFLTFASLDEPEAGESSAPIIEVDTVETAEPEAVNDITESGNDIVEEYPPVLGTPDGWPEWLGEETDNPETSERVKTESIQSYNDDESDFLETSNVTINDIYFTLNSIFFILVLWSACAVVFLICKTVFPLFRGGR